MVLFPIASSEPKAGVDLPKENEVAAKVVPEVITFQYSFPLVLESEVPSAVETPVANA